VTSLPISVVVLTLNEERNIGDCLGSVVGWANEVVVVDSGSGDRTVAIAESRGARVVGHPFDSHSSQWSWALDCSGLQSPWVFGLDADQRATPELVESLRRTFSESGPRNRAIVGFYVSRRQVFRGRWIMHGGYYPKYLLKLFRADAVYFDEHDLMDHHFYVRGETAKLAGDIIEDNANEQAISFWVAKHNRYAALVAREELARQASASAWPQSPALFRSPDQRVMWLKQRWYGLPLYIRPALYFVYRYALRRGFLDGKQGFIFHFMHAFWYRLLVDINLDEIRNRPGISRNEGLVPDESSTRRPSQPTLSDEALL